MRRVVTPHVKPPTARPPPSLSTYHVRRVCSSAFQASLEFFVDERIMHVYRGRTVWPLLKLLSPEILLRCDHGPVLGLFLFFVVI